MRDANSDFRHDGGCSLRLLENASNNNVVIGEAEDGLVMSRRTPHQISLILRGSEQLIPNSFRVVFLMLVADPG